MSSRTFGAIPTLPRNSPIASAEACHRLMRSLRNKSDNTFTVCANVKVGPNIWSRRVVSLISGSVLFPRSLKAVRPRVRDDEELDEELCWGSDPISDC
jgi:hypothetical protein